jgi:hypothetical protein
VRRVRTGSVVRAARGLGLALVVGSMLAGCNLVKGNDSNCTNTGPGTVGGQTAVCVQPPPTQFDQMNK